MQIRTIGRLRRALRNDQGRRGIRRRLPLTILCVVGLIAASFSVNPASADSGADRLRVSVDRAPVTPDGDVAGAPTDLLVTFADPDPTTPGVALKAGGTVRVRLPKAFVNEGVLPVADTGSAPDCAPPVVSACSTAVLTQGWPQSPVLPFPSVEWEADTNTIVLTANADWPSTGIEQPGPKAVHLLLLGFSNPDQAGMYRLAVEIKPDPNSDRVLRGATRTRIKRSIQPAISPNSQANGAPPPPFPNTLFQSVRPGEPSNTMTFYMWDGAGEALVGADFAPGAARMRPITDTSGQRVGSVRVRVPRGAKNWSLDSGGPSALGTAFLTGIPVGRMTAVFTTDPDVFGAYTLEFKLANGNTLEHVIRSEYRSTSPVMWEWDDTTVVGTSSLLRTPKTLDGEMTVTGLTPGDAVTMWIAFFTDPTACSTTPCSRPADVGNPATGADLYWVDGLVVDDSGTATFSGTLKLNQRYGSLKDEVGLVPGVRLTDPLGSEVALALHSHGPALTGKALRNQLTTFLGGCDVLTGIRGFAQGFEDLPDEVGECTTFQSAAHLAP